MGWSGDPFGGGATNVLSQTLAHLKREIAEKGWAEACHWAGGQIADGNTICRASSVRM